MMEHINNIRTNPKTYIPYLDSIKSYTILELNQVNSKKILLLSYGKNVSILDKKIDLLSSLIEDIEESIIFLDTVKPVHKLIFDSTMYNNLQNFDVNESFKWLSKTKYVVKHISKILPDHSHWGENIFFNEEDPLLVILGFVIDTGEENKDKGHRKNIFNPEWDVFAVIQSTDKSTRISYIQNFAKLKP